MLTWDKPLKVDNNDSYSITVNQKWLDDESIVSASVIVDDPLVAETTGGADIVAGKTVAVGLNGIAEGFTRVHIEYSTATRTDCFSAGLHVVKDCL